MSDTPRFVFIVAAWQAEQWIEACLESIERQTVETYDVIVVDDMSTDGTAERAAAWCAGASHGGEWVFHANREKKWALRNQVEMIRAMNHGNPDDVIVFVDGDDRLAHDRVLEKLSEVYNAGALVTYGSYQPDPPSATCFPATPYPPDVVAARDYRAFAADGRGVYFNHLRTFRYRVFNELTDDDFRDQHGAWMNSTTDTALMIPCMELAGDRVVFIPDVLLVYNSENPNADWRTRAEQVDADHYHVLHRLPKKPALVLPGDPAPPADRTMHPPQWTEEQRAQKIKDHGGTGSEPWLPSEERIEVLRDYGRRFQLHRFVETGTAGGDTPAALAADFDRLYTIEVGLGAYEAAARRFAGTNVLCFHGDSAQWLPQILGLLDEPALFWLDGHYCGGDRGEKDTPIVEELEAIFATRVPHVILVDDARLFAGMSHAGEHDWPHIDEVRALADKHGYRFDVADDIVRLTP